VDISADGGSNTFVSAYSVEGAISGLSNTKAVVIHMQSGAFTGLFNINTGSVPLVASGDGSGAYKYVYCYIDGTRYRFPVRAD
jgi:hypothetical protein